MTYFSRLILDLEGTYLVYSGIPCPLFENMSAYDILGYCSYQQMLDS